MNQKKHVTWDMIAVKLDDELQDIQSYLPSGVHPSLISYFRVSVAHIHRHLKRYKIPEDMYETFYGRNKILGQIAHHWIDEAKVRGGDTRDKESVAAISVKNWLEQVRREELEAALKGLSLYERTLIYSEVELSTDDRTTTFLTGGIPDQYDISDVEQYRDFVDELSPETEVIVSVSSWSVGNGESENAADDELIVIARNQKQLEKLLGIDSLQTDRFTVFES